MFLHFKCVSNFVKVIHECYFVLHFSATLCCGRGEQVCNCKNSWINKQRREEKLLQSGATKRLTNNLAGLPKGGCNMFCSTVEKNSKHIRLLCVVQLKYKPRPAELLITAAQKRSPLQVDTIPGFAFLIIGPWRQ